MIPAASAAAGSGSQLSPNIAPTIAAKGARKIKPAANTGPIGGISPAAEAPHQAECEIVEEARAARAREKLSHQHERDHDGGSDFEHQAEQTVVVEVEINRERRGLDLVRAQLARNQMAEQHPDDQRE